jgi:hypothetical protein
MFSNMSLAQAQFIVAAATLEQTSGAVGALAGNPLE